MATELPTPQSASEFSFPIATPYSIQLDFMQRLFETIEKREFAIFESPTGTGKSLSIICGALTWLQHNSERKARMAAAPSVTTLTLGSDGDASKPDWVIAHDEKQQLERETAELDSEDAQWQKYLRWVASIRRREAAEHKQGMASRRATPMSNKVAESNKCKLGDNGDDSSDDDMLLVDPCSSGDSAQAPGRADDNGHVHYSAAVRKLLERRADNRPLYDSSSDGDDDHDGESGDSAAPPKEPSVTKIIYASRTHSQIQQFISEIKRTQFGTGENKVKCVTLGSRSQLCMNKRARQGTSSVHAINERCLEMQQKSAGGKKSARCEYLPLQYTPMLDFKDATASMIMDIEELAKEGQRRCT
ncbi:ATP-dependent DNA helicase chl1, partial [Coemansia sp. RSA 1694]